MPLRRHLCPESPAVPWQAVAFSHLILLKVDIAQVQDGGQDAENAVLVFPAETQHLHGSQEPAEVVRVTLPRNLTIPTLGKGRARGQGPCMRAGSPPGPCSAPMPQCGQSRSLSSSSIPIGREALSRYCGKRFTYISFL